MKIKPFLIALCIGFSTAGFAADKELEIGKDVPDFSLKDQSGKTVKLSQYKKDKKYVVLEWLNHGCPFVRKHYDSNNMQNVQETYTKKGVVWLSINSSAPGREGAYASGKEAASDMKKYGSKATAVLLDPSGEVGHKFSALTTPHMFVINPEGKLLYQGAFDDKPTSDPEDIKTAKNLVAAALDEAMAGKPVTTAATKPYGCSVKYKK